MKALPRLEVGLCALPGFPGAGQGRSSAETWLWASLKGSRWCCESRKKARLGSSSSSSPVRSTTGGGSSTEHCPCEALAALGTRVEGALGEVGLMSPSKGHVLSPEKPALSLCMDRRVSGTTHLSGFQQDMLWAEVSALSPGLGARSSLCVPCRALESEVLASSRGVAGLGFSRMVPSVFKGQRFLSTTCRRKEALSGSAAGVRRTMGSRAVARGGGRQARVAGLSL